MKCDKTPTGICIWEDQNVPCSECEYGNKPQRKKYSLLKDLEPF